MVAAVRNSRLSQFLVWLPLLVLVICTGVISVIVAVTHEQITQIQKQNLQHDAQFHLGKLLEEHHRNRAETAITQALATRSGGKWTYAAIDASGRILYASRGDWAGRQADDAIPDFSANRFSQARSENAMSTGVEKNDHVTGYMPLHRRSPSSLSAPESVLYLDFGAPDLTTWGEVFRSISPIVLAIFISMLVFHWLLHVLVGKPLKTLADASIAFADGQFSTVIPARGSGELIDLAHTFNRMSAKITKTVSKLREREVYLSATLHSIGDAVIVTDRDGKVTMLNAVAEHLCGRSEAETCGKPVTEILHLVNATTREPMQNPVRQVLRTGDTVTPANHTMLISHDGSEYHIADSAAPIRDQDGDIEGVVMVMRDVTSDYALRESLKHQRNIYNAMSEINRLISQQTGESALFQAVCDILIKYIGFAKCRIMKIDRSGEHLTTIASAGQIGTGDEEMKSLPIRNEDMPPASAFSGDGVQLFNSVTAMKPAAVGQQTVVKEGAESCASFVIYRDGKPYAVLHNCSDYAGFYSDEIVQLLTEIGQDLTYALEIIDVEISRKKTEQQLRIAHEFSDTLIESLPGIMYLISADSRFLRWNHNFEQSTGYTAAEVRVLNPLQLFKAEDTARAHAALEQVFRDGYAAIEIELLTKNGALIPHLCIGRRIMVDGMPCMLGSAMDISMQKQAENDIRMTAEAMADGPALQIMERLVKTTAGVLGTDYCFIGKLNMDGRNVTTAAFWDDGRCSDSFTYNLADTPCETIIMEGECVYPEKVKDLFPEDHYLAQMKIESYAGVPLFNASGNILGHMCVYSRKPIKNVNHTLMLLRIFAMRAAQEIERQQYESDLQIAATTFETQEAIYITDADGNIVRVNHAFTTITGYHEQMAIGKNARMLDSDMLSAAINEQAFDTIHKDGRWLGEVNFKHCNGHDIPVRLSITAVYDTSRHISHYVCMLNDISAEREAKAEIERMAYYDELTGLPNRRLLLTLMDQSIALSQRSKLFNAVMFLDLDNFKHLNDALGHAVGDALLKQVANRMKVVLRQEDIVARLGGDEFVVLLSSLGVAVSSATRQAQVVAEKLRAAINEPYYLGDHVHYITPSIGIVLFPVDSESADDLLKQADTAMYRSKGAGRNRISFYEAGMQLEVETRLGLEKDLRQSLADNDLFVVFQPQVNADGDHVGAEALIRWRHPKRGMVPPAKFIPIAEETGLIEKIGDIALHQACMQISKIEKMSLAHQHGIAVNISPIQFRQPALLNQIRSVIDKYDIDPNLLTLEVTEAVVVANINETRKKMLELKKLGIKFAIDDFGTGYSSLAYLLGLPLDILKIDRIFIKRTEHGKHNRAIIEAIISLAEHMNLKVVTEGIESGSQWATLKACGCSYAQGFYFSQPLTVDEYDELLLKGSINLVATSEYGIRQR